MINRHRWRKANPHRRRLPVAAEAGVVQEAQVVREHPGALGPRSNVVRTGTRPTQKNDIRRIIRLTLTLRQGGLLSSEQ